MGAFHLVKISGISGSAVNGTRFVGSSTGEFPEKVENLKRWARFPRGGGGTPIHYLYGYVPPKGVVILKLLI